MSHPRIRCAGFTLIELMVTVALAAILAFVAVPNLSAFKRNGELTSATNSLVAAISTARSEALKRGTNTLVLPLSGTSFVNGWIVFVDMNLNNVFDSNTDILVKQQEPLPTYFVVTQSLTSTTPTGQPYIRYDASGYSKEIGGGFLASTYSIARNDVSGDELLRQTRRIIIGPTGRVRTCNPKTDRDCAVTSR